METLTGQKKEKVLDILGKQVIEEVRDHALSFAVRKATGKTPNPQVTEQYKILRTLTNEQREKINELISETITTTIFEFLHIFGDNLKLIIIDDDGKEYDYSQLTEHGGSEIIVAEGVDNDWITKFSKLKI